MPTSDEHLTGVFAPVSVERTDAPCEVVQGAIPRDLAGTYLRNGPNPRFSPLGSYTYPLDGDGMLHAVSFEDGAARYRNRFVRTPSLAAEERAGRALWGGVLTPIVPSADLVGPELAEKPFRDMPAVNVVRHGGRLLALAESDLPYAMTDGLDTTGAWTFGGALPGGMCAHPKIDPRTGDMVVFRYAVDEPHLSWAVVGADGAVTHGPRPIAIDATYMIHDFAITERHLVLLVCPLRMNLTGGPMLAWEPERGTRVAVVRRDGSDDAIRWFETEAFWVWHIANAHEAPAADGSERLVVDYAFWSHPGFGVAHPSEGGLHRMVLDLARSAVAVERRDDRPIEFPRIDDRRIGRPHRFLHTAAKDPDAPCAPGTWNALRRYDVERGTSVERRSGRVILGEAVFVPRADATSDGESDGYLLVYAFDGDETHLLLLDADAIAGEPVATLRMPQRVPLGLHGTWVPAP